jgi:hypothetical protein
VLSGDKALPPVISVNAMVSNSELFEVWRKPGYLPSEVSLRPSNGDIELGDGLAYEIKESRGKTPLTPGDRGADSRFPRIPSSPVILC